MERWQRDDKFAEVLNEAKTQLQQELVLKVEALKNSKEKLFYMIKRYAGMLAQFLCDIAVKYFK